jgi:hypothetical protein
VLTIKIAGKRISNPILIILFSLLSVVCYADAIDLEHKKPVTKNETSGQFCVAETFNDVLSWFTQKLETLDEKYLKKSDPEQVASPEVTPADSYNGNGSDAKSVLLIKPLNLTIPDEEQQGIIKMDKNMIGQLPDLFSGQNNQPYVKEKPSASFGGRILMDDAELEGMEEYRLKDMTDAVRGAEVSLEFKTN